MTKQELLTKLATECATWGECLVAHEFAGTCTGFMREDWLAERERLLNKPSWKDAPDGAAGVMMEKDGCWYFYNNYAKDAEVVCYPERGVFECLRVDDRAMTWSAGKAIAIPAGYDWRESLEERPAWW